jgi:hypothetical protein
MTATPSGAKNATTPKRRRSRMLSGLDLKTTHCLTLIGCANGVRELDTPTATKAMGCANARIFRLTENYANHT